MKAIILAAGEGKRLRPLTDNVPKCLVRYQGKPLLDYLLETLRDCGIGDIVIVKGYRAEAIQHNGARSYVNERYATTNMVTTLFSAAQELTGEVIVTYSDIIYGPHLLRTLMAAREDFAVAVDKNWHSLWRARMEDPLSDAETLKINGQGYITELGRKPSSLDDIQGQYMGLFKISAGAVERVKNFYYSLDRNTSYEGRDFDNMFMTAFIQQVIDRLLPVKAIPVSGGWLEIDQLSDLDVSVTLT